jgi:hypothetical protein
MFTISVCAPPSATLGHWPVCVEVWKDAGSPDLREVHWVWQDINVVDAPPPSPPPPQTASFPVNLDRDAGNHWTYQSVNYPDPSQNKNAVIAGVRLVSHDMTAWHTDDEGNESPAYVLQANQSYAAFNGLPVGGKWTAQCSSSSQQTPISMGFWIDWKTP